MTVKFYNIGLRWCPYYSSNGKNSTLTLKVLLLKFGAVSTLSIVKVSFGFIDVRALVTAPLKMGGLVFFIH